MAATYAPASGAARDRARLLIPDKTIDGLTPSGGVYTLVTFLFTDDEIDGLIATEGSALRAAAAAVLSLIGSQAQIQKIAGFGFSIDSSAAALREHAQFLLERADAEEAAAGGLFDIAEQVPNEFAARERLWNQRLRGQV